MDAFDDYTVNMDSECINQDFDSVDLYGEIMVENNDTFGDDLILE